MKKTISQYEFIDAMRDSDSFTYDGLVELYDYLDGIESEYEFDATEVRTSFTQTSIDEFLFKYAINCESVASNTYKKIVITSYIEKNGFWFSFVENDTSIIFEDF
jgi:hypothetical protein